jgi:thiol:disulfide interchange protein
MRHFLILLLLVLTPWAAHANTPETPETKVQTRLIAGQSAVVPHQSMQVGIELNVPAGWHIYGPTSANIGLPTQVDWHLPAGYRMSDIAWPDEEKFKFQKISGRGYTGKVILPALLTPPDTAKAGDSAQVGAHVEWLVCKEVCIPENADLFLQLPVAATAVPTADANLLNPVGIELDPLTLTSAILLALLGGLVLNLMPCVFPILSMKAISLIQKSRYENRRDVVKSGWLYAAGVITSFWVLAGILIVLKWVGVSAGWGLQLQSPVFILLLAAVLFIVGLMLSDILRINGSVFSQFGDVLTHRPSFWGPFFTGVLAVLVATPCTAPFMGGAMFFAFTQNLLVTLLVFTALGLGLAAPYLFLTLYPPILKLLPKPGEWMVTLKRALAIPMYLAAGWLVWVFVQQTAIIPHHTAKYSEPYSEKRLAELRAAHQPVFVNMTASWCITCLLNEKDTLSRTEVQAAFKEHHVAYLAGDWTDRNAAITQFLAEYRRVGVPLYVYFPPMGKPKVLPQILTPRIVEGAITGKP